MALAEHVGREQTFTALGGTYTLSRWTRKVWSDFLDWAREVLPDPREAAAVFCAEMLKRLPGDALGERMLIVQQALAKATGRLSINSPETVGLLSTTDGALRLFGLLLKQHHPDLTDEDVFDLYMAIGGDRVDELAMRCSGAAPGPKADPGNAGESPPPTSRPTGNVLIGSSPPSTA